MHTLLSRLLDTLFPRRALDLRLDALQKEELTGKIREQTVGGATYFFAYGDPLIREMLRALKFRGKRALARTIAEAVYDPLLDILSDEELFSGLGHPLLISIPLSRARLRERGYNQSAEIAKELARLDGKRTFTLALDVLERVKDTPPQTSLSDKQGRQSNVRGVFGVKNPALAAGHSIVLLDDIVTTGATLKEAGEALTRAGATKVFCVAVAH